MLQGDMLPIDFDRVADLYDVYVRTGMDVPFWLEECRDVRGKVLELMSGTGRVSLPLLHAGVRLVCVDRAPAMLARLQAKAGFAGLPCEVYCQDVAELDLPEQYPLIFIPFHSFQEILSDTARQQALARIRRHLAAGGCFVCTLQNPVVRTAGMDGIDRPIGVFPMDDGRSLSLSARMMYDPVSQIATGVQTYALQDPHDAITETRTLDIRFRLYRREEFEGLLERSGFEVREVYGDYERGRYEGGQSPFIIVRARGM